MLKNLLRIMISSILEMFGISSVKILITHTKLTSLESKVNIILIMCIIFTLLHYFNIRI